MVTSLIRGPGVPKGVTSYAPMHATDWLPTLVSMATGGRDFREFAPVNEPPYLLGDGMDVWSSIVNGGVEPYARNWVLLETHPESADFNRTVHGHSLILGDWKYLTMGPDMEAHDDEDGCKFTKTLEGARPSFPLTFLRNTHTHTHTKTVFAGFVPPGQNPSSVNYTINCKNPAGGPPKNGPAPLKECAYPSSCLFNVKEDPCEYNNVAKEHPEIVAQLKKVFAANFSGTAVPPIEPSGCNPKLIQVQGPGGPGTWIFSFQPCDA